MKHYGAGYGACHVGALLKEKLARKTVGGLSLWRDGMRKTHSCFFTSLQVTVLVACEDCFFAAQDFAVVKLRNVAQLVEPLLSLACRKPWVVFPALHLVWSCVPLIPTLRRWRQWDQ